MNVVFQGHVHLLLPIISKSVLADQTVLIGKLPTVDYCPASQEWQWRHVCLQSYHGLIIDISLVYLSYPQDRINTQVIYRFALAQVECTM